MTQSSSSLSDITKLIEEDFGYTIYTASEIEFYFKGGDESKDNEVLALVLKKCQDDELVIANMSFETGHRQYEIALAEVNNATITCEHTGVLKNNITEIANKFGIKADFSAKPFAQQPGCGLHIHIHLENNNHFNVFQKSEADNDDESEALLFSVGGLLDTMLESMIYFAPKEEDYKRYTARTNDDIPDDQPLRRYNNAPVKVSWGSNNRTVAIRVPTSTRNPKTRHIEHRVASPNANIYDVLTVIIAAIHHGIAHKIPPSEKIHGNAFDSQYNRPLLPNSLKGAQEFATKGKIIKTYLQDI